MNLTTEIKSHLKKYTGETNFTILKVIEMLFKTKNRRLPITSILPIICTHDSPEELLKSAINRRILWVEDETVELLPDIPPFETTVPPPYLEPVKPGTVRNSMTKDIQNPVPDGVEDVIAKLNQLRFSKLNLPIPAYQKYEIKQILDTRRFLKDNPFYLSHFNDLRGRIYPIGYAINYQGDSFHKASLLFGDS